MDLLLLGDKAIDDAMIEVFAECERKPFFDADRTLAKTKVLFELSKQNGLSRRELLVLTGLLNVPDAIAKLRADGWQIETERFNIPNRDGKIVRVGRYWLSKPHHKYAGECFAR